MSETPAQRCARLVNALDDLVAQETAALHNHDFAVAAAIPDRIAPLLERLQQDAAHIAAVTRTQLVALHARREENRRRLEAEMSRCAGELQQMHVTRRRVAKIAPAYSDAAAPRSRLCATG